MTVKELAQLVRREREAREKTHDVCADEKDWDQYWRSEAALTAAVAEVLATPPNP